MLNVSMVKETKDTFIELFNYILPNGKKQI